MTNDFDPPDTSPDPAIAAVLVGRLGGLLDRVQRYRRRTTRHGRPEDVHQLRASLRRLATTTALATDAIDLPSKAAARFQCVVTGLGDLRDVDVLTALIGDLAITAPADASRELESLGTRTAAGRGKQLNAARRLLGQAKSRRPLLELRRALRHPTRLPFGFRPTSAAGRLLADAGWERLFTHPGWGVEAGGSVDLTRSGDRALHELRREVKRQRELLDGLGQDPATGETLVQVGAELGRIHDLTKLLRLAPARHRHARLSIRLALDAALTGWATHRPAHLTGLRSSSPGGLQAALLPGD